MSKPGRRERNKAKWCSSNLNLGPSRAAPGYLVWQLHEHVRANLVDPPTVRGAYENVSVVVSQGLGALAEAANGGQCIY